MAQVQHILWHAIILVKNNPNLHFCCELFCDHFRLSFPLSRLIQSVTVVHAGNFINGMEYNIVVEHRDAYGVGFCHLG